MEACIPNLLLMRTSPTGLLVKARILLDPEWLSPLEKLRLPYNCDLTQLIAEKFTVSVSCTQPSDQDLTTVMSDVCALDGIEVFPTDANFILFRMTPEHMQVSFQSLKAQHLDQNLYGSHRFENCLRVTVERLLKTYNLLSATASLDRPH